MTVEDSFIQKTYYKMFINEHENVHPIQVLGDLFQEEQKKDMPELSYIRFAQGEVYFHNKDYEAAIFKWENIANELEPWAKKNMADAYYELGLLSTAEDVYKAIETENLILTTEVALQLFSLYIERGKLEDAVMTIKRTVAQNPDYPNVTQLARSFFEKQKDWGNAIELAVNESIRTESIPWFTHLKNYADQGLTKLFVPGYFSKSLTVLFYLDQGLFEELISSLWKVYKQEDVYFQWLREATGLLSGLEVSRNGGWSGLSEIFKETYFELISGKYLIKQVQELLPGLLSTWLRLTDSKQAIWAATAVLSWSELFPSSFSEQTVSDAETLFSHSEKTVDVLEECLCLFDAIMEWAGGHDMGANARLKWMVEQLLDYDTRYIFIAGLSGTGKSSFVNFVLGEDILRDESTSTVAVFKDGEQLSIHEMTDQEVTSLATIDDFQERMGRRRNATDSLLIFKHPNSFMRENKLAFIDTPGLTSHYYDRDEVLKYLSVADAILFILDVNAPLTDQEQMILSDLHERSPEIPIHFLLNKMDLIHHEQEAIQIFDKTRSAVQAIFPGAGVFGFSVKYERNGQLKDLAAFLRSMKKNQDIEEKRLEKLLHFVRTTISTLLQKRIDVENQLEESIRWNEEIVQKLTGALNQLSDMEQQKETVITRSYRTIKEKLQQEMNNEIPKLLKECSKLIKEDSDFRNIHLQLNDEMNRILQDYLDNQVMPEYYSSLQQWIATAQEEFEQAQEYLDEMGNGFNALYGEERLKLDSDFKVLDDWRRDTDRMTSRYEWEKVNILLRRTPSQLLLKGTGKLFGALRQNKTMVYNKYKTYVETEDYSETAKLVIKRFFQQFELFEKSLGRDIHFFFRNPQDELSQSVETAHTEIESNKAMLAKMNANPEMYHDPLKLFELKLRQYEWMTVSGKSEQIYHG